MPRAPGPRLDQTPWGSGSKRPRLDTAMQRLAHASAVPEGGDPGPGEHGMCRRRRQSDRIGLEPATNGLRDSHGNPPKSPQNPVSRAVRGFPHGRRRPHRLTGFRDLAVVKAYGKQLEMGVFSGRSELETGSKPARSQMKGGVHVTVDVTPRPAWPCRRLPLVATFRGRRSDLFPF
jgi:hypothetical protein